jgi:sugar phosphate isomerase/epimerase
MTYRARMHTDQIALQLYTVRQAAALDLPGTLDAVARTGYRHVEVAGLPDTSPGQLAGLLAAAGLDVVAVHESIDALRADADAAIERSLAIGSPRIVVPWMPDADRATPDDVRRFAGELGTLARRAATHGLRFGYHNHSFEFADLDGTTIWDVLRADLPDEVDLEIDVYWAAGGGLDPAALIASATGRVKTLHMKDRGPGPAFADVPAGQGTLDFPAIVAAGRAAGVEWYIAEQDDAVSPLDDIATARAYLQSLAE